MAVTAEIRILPDDAIEWLKRAPFDGGTEIEVRPIFKAEDFGAELTPELREREERMREQIAGKKKGEQLASD